MTSLFFNKQFLAGVMEKRLTEQLKDTSDERLLYPSLFPWQTYGSRDIIVQRLQNQARLAGLYGPEGQAVPTPGISPEQMAYTLMDVKALETIDPEILKKDANIAAIASHTRNVLIDGIRDEVRNHVTEKVSEATTRVTRTINYMAMQMAWNGGIQWPPVDNANDPISNPPAYFNSRINGKFPSAQPAELNQDIASLVDYTGTAATADQQKYWSDPTADIFGAMDVADQICKQNHGFSIYQGKMYGRSSLAKHLVKNTAFLNSLRGSNLTDARDALTPNQLRQRFMEFWEFNFVSLDDFWTYEDWTGDAYTPVSVNYLPERYVFFTPPGQDAIGEMATTYMQSGPDLERDWTSEMFAWHGDTKTPPFKYEVGVDSVALPISKKYNWFTLKVLADPS